MNTTAMIKSPPPSAGHLWTATPDARPRASEFPPLWERLNEILPLIFVVPVAGPPVILLLGPLLLLVLLLIPPTALLITLLVAALVMAGLLAVLVGIVASPYLLVRHLRKHGTRPRARHTSVSGSREFNPAGVGVLTQRSNTQLFNGPAARPTPTAHLRNPTPSHLTSEGL